jgi:hypothetical protein
MRSKLFALLFGCGFAFAAMTPTFGCDYQTNASSASNAPQQTAQAQQSSDTSAQQ